VTVSLNLQEILSKTSTELSLIVDNADTETQAAIRFLLTNIKKKDHRALVKFLQKQHSLDCIHEYYNGYKKMNFETLSSHIKKTIKTLSLSALIAGLFIIQSVAAGDPLTLTFSDSRDQLIEQQYEVENDDLAWLYKKISLLTDSRVSLSVSEWSEQKRYLPPQVSSMPGFYRYSVAPYLKEIADCMSVTSPIREIDFMKAAQIGATVGILENTIGYIIDHVKSAPVMLLTADAELAKLRVESYITPMLEHSGLNHLIQSADINNSRKSGKTDKRIEWAGGGFLIPLGALNASKLRSLSIQYLLEDEVDAYPDKVGKSEDPQKTAEARTKAYHESRKIARISTPLIKNKSRIHRGYLRGDQRKWFVPCKKCHKKQELKFKGLDKKTGQIWGLVWTMTDGILDVDSVKYLCQFCGYAHSNYDKAYILPRGEWRATATAKSITHRSYHINAMYSPLGMYPWSAAVLDWLEAWDEESGTVRNVGLLQEFYNNVLGQPFEIRGSKIRFISVSGHRRACYRLGQIPNHYASQHCGSPILFLTCTVDVHKKNLAVAVMGWTRDARCFVIDYWRFNTVDDNEECGELSSTVWRRLRQLIEETEYTADDGKKYRIVMTFIDAGYMNDTVTRFCADYASGVYPTLGRDRPSKNQTIKEFAKFNTQSGTIGYRIVVDHYKDRLSPVLRREWQEESGLQPTYHFNAPVDITDKQLKELTVESRKEKTDDKGNVAYYWHRPHNAPNELFDLLVYGSAAMEILAFNICIEHFELETIDWAKFWDFIHNEKLYFTEELN